MTHRVKKLDSRVMSQHATCATCGEEWDTKNAMAVGKRHAEAHGHQVTCDQTIVVTYKPVDD